MKPDFAAIVSIDIEVPRHVKRVAAQLRDKGYQAYIVGGAVRDSIMGRNPKDWDVSTSATPEQVQDVFEGRTIPTGERFGTITVLCGAGKIEVTTFRSEGSYGDGRRPDWVAFSKDIVDDLSRRDFTVNAIAYDVDRRAAIDCYNGIRDIGERIIRAVGDPCERFTEDALRMMRAVRLAAELDFEIHPETLHAISESHHGISKVSWERIRDELSAMMLSPHPGKAMCVAQETGLLGYILPELAACADIPLYPGISDTLLEHSLRACGNIEPKLHLRLAALLHDIGKPAAMAADDAGRMRFFSHERTGADLAKQALDRLRYPGELVARVTVLVGRHMFTYEPATKDKGIRRIVASLGLDTIYDLAKLRCADRAAVGAGPGPGSNMMAFLERVCDVLRQGPALTVRDLAVNGNDVIQTLDIPEGPEVGRVLAELLDAVLENPGLNTRDRLLAMLRER